MKFLLIASLLVSMSVNVFASDNQEEKNTPSPVDLELLESTYLGFKDGVLQALQKGADIHAKVSIDYIKSSAYDGPLTIHVEEQTAIVIAVDKKFANIVKILLEHGASTSDKDDWGDSVLHKATWWNNLEMVKLLLQHGADANGNAGKGFLPLGKAIRNDNVEMVKVLLEHGADPNGYGYLDSPPLHEAAVHGGLAGVPSFFSSKHEKIMLLLLQFNADPNFKSKSGKTPLMAAANLGFSRGAKVLIQHGAKIEESDNSGNTALIIAAETEDGLGVVKRLLKAEADVNAVNEDGNTALHAASKNEKGHGIVKALIKANADVSAVNKDGNTALHIAADAYEGADKIVESLLENGANPNAVNKRGTTPLDLAIANLKSAKKGESGQASKQVKRLAAVVRMLRRAAEDKA